jgi:type III pantothenate kinase
MHQSVNAAIDFGNTYVKLGFFTGTEMTEFHHGLRIEKVRALLNKKAPAHLIIASVTKSPADLEKLFVKFPKKIILGSGTPLPIKNDYATPETLGYDRLAAAVGANARFPDQPALIIDMGTAIKYDFITAGGVFKGGIISPGMKMRFKALHVFTKKLPLLDPDGIPPLVGDSTASCIRSGVINGIIAEVNGIIERYNQYPDLQVVLCGGGAPFFESQIKYPKFAASNLVLEGLNRILLHNVE